MPNKDSIDSRLTALSEKLAHLPITLDESRKQLERHEVNQTRFTVLLDEHAKALDRLQREIHHSDDALGDKSAELRKEIECTKSEFDRLRTELQDRRKAVQIWVPAFGLVFTVLGLLGVPAIINTLIKNRISDVEQQAKQSLESARVAGAAISNKLVEFQRRAVVVLAADHAPSDQYAVGMRAKMLRVANDIGHIEYIELPHFDAYSAAMKLVALRAFFPKGTVFAVQFNPAGRGIDPYAVETKDGTILIAFRNEMTDTLVSEFGGVDRAFLITNQEVTKEAGNLQHRGISFLAPAAAYLARHGDIATLGPRTDYPNPQRRSHPIENGKFQATPLHVDSFGNILLSVRDGDFNGKLRLNSTLTIGVKNKQHRVQYCQDYIDVRDGEPLLLKIGDFLQLSVNGKRAADFFNVTAQDRILVEALQ